MTDQPHRTARCSCGALELELSGDPDFVVMCHCEACQRRTGAPFGVGAYFKKARIVRQSGQHRTYERTAETGRKLTYHFCPTCGTSLYWTLEMRPDHLGVGIGSFDDPAFPAANRAIWTVHKRSWLPLPEGIPAHEGPSPPQ